MDRFFAHINEVSYGLNSISWLSCFIKNAKNYPDKIAIEYDEHKVNYSTLNRWASIISSMILNKKIEGDYIGLCCDRSPYMIAAMIGIQKAGKAYLPLDPSFPEQRLHYMVESSSTELVITEKTKKHIFSGQDQETVFIDDLDFSENCDESSFSEQLPLADNPAYILYTSGSTGLPKGVIIPHRAFINFLYSMRDILQLDSNVHTLAITTISFDISGLEIFLPLLCGGTLTLVDSSASLDPRQLHASCSKPNISLIQATPATWRVIFTSGSFDAYGKTLLCGGEAMSEDLARELLETRGRVWNVYGPTETTVWSSIQELEKPVTSVPPIGQPLADTGLHILDGDLKPVNPGEIGELYISGTGLAIGYHDPEKTSERFIVHPDYNIRIYRTGDLVQEDSNGNIFYKGRVDTQVKFHGFRIELNEIESSIEKTEGIYQAVVVLHEDKNREQRLAAYVVETAKGCFNLPKIRVDLSKTLPEYMIPSLFMVLDEIPLSPNGKVDRSKLPAISRKRPDIAQPYIAAHTLVQKKLVDLWKLKLDIEDVGIDDSFFDIGGTSLLALDLVLDINREFDTDFQVVKIFQYPTISEFEKILEKSSNDPLLSIGQRYTHDSREERIAIVGLAGRFPGADCVDDLWQNLVNKIESITHFDASELGPGIPQDLLDNPDYIPARGIIENVEFFDAAFFGISPLEATVMDPQQRVFLELAWNALENAGYDSQNYNGLIGAFAGTGDNHYYSLNLHGHKTLLDTVGPLPVEYGNEKDYFATRTCYALDLTGPGVSVNTGCSTTLLAVDLACRSLRDRECDMALAGGIDIHVPQRSGFLYQPGGTFARDGHCRPFDADASGTMFCDGAGVVVLKRLNDAIVDRDTIYAVILATAKNNDGAGKVSFLAPSVDGQARAIAMAHAMADIDPEQIGYIEAHGTATPVGDPIEIEALTRAFRLKTEKKQFCRIGSIKGNIGHPTNAAGVAGIIKAALCLHNERIPGTMHYKNPNPHIDFENSPFVVADKTIEWKRGDKKRNAAVSSFGFGGTNVHAILQEAPVGEKSTESRPVQLLFFSAKTDHSLDAMTNTYKSFLETVDASGFADSAFVLKKGRRNFPLRRFYVCTDQKDAITQISEPDVVRSGNKLCQNRDPDIVFLFPGQGSQYSGMGRELYLSEPLFRQTMDRCFEILKPHLGCDLKDYLFDVSNPENSEILKNTFYTQPAIFCIEYALALLLMSWGIKPVSMVGHSVGEFVCACLAGTFSLEDALTIIAARGRLMQDLPRGSMLSVRIAASDIENHLPNGVQLAASNGPLLSVVSGPDEAIRLFIQELEKEDVPCKLLHTSHAFHSSMMDPVVPKITELLSTVELRMPLMPFYSTVYGDEMPPEEVINPEYWGKQLRMPVRFSEVARKMIQMDNTVFLEIGPRTTLSTLMRQHRKDASNQAFIASLSDNARENNEIIPLLTALGQLWLHGVNIDWDAFYMHEKRNRIAVPGYRFDRKKYWVDPVSVQYQEEVLQQEPLEHDAQETASDGVKNQSVLWQRLDSLLEEISGLQVSSNDPDTTFLDMGMDSLLLAQVAFRISREFNIKLTFGNLIREYPNRVSLSNHLLKESGLTVEQEPEQKDSRQNEITTLKNMLYAKEKHDPDSIFIPGMGSDRSRNGKSIRVVLEFDSSFDLEKFREAAEVAVSRHKALTVLSDSEGRILSASHTRKPELTIINLTEKEDKSASQIFESRVRESGKSVFSMSEDVALKIFVFRFPNQKSRVLLIFNQSLCDGWSQDVILEEISGYYDSGHRWMDRYPSSPPDYYAFCEYLFRYKNSESFKESVLFLEEMYKKPPPPLIIKGFSAISTDDCAGNLIVDIPDFLDAGLKRLASMNKCSMYMLLVSSFAFFLQKVTGLSDFVIGLPVAMQSILDERYLVGNCKVMLPLRIRQEKINARLADVIDIVQNRFFDFDEHLQTLYHWEGAERYISVVFSGSAAYKKGELFPSTEGFNYYFKSQSRIDHDLEIDYRETDQGSFLVTQYKSTIVSESRVSELLNEFLQFLCTLAGSECREDPVIESFYPLSSAQKRLWFFHQLDKQSPAYNLALCFRIYCSLDIEIFKKTLEKLVVRHEVFRTCFRLKDGTPEAVVFRKPQLEFEHIVLSNGSMNEQQIAVQDIVRRVTGKPFSFEKLPMHRFFLIETSREEYVLFLSVPHILLDGWSVSRMQEELEKIYDAETGSRDSCLEKIPVSYQEYVAREAQILHSCSYEEGVPFWSSYIGANPQPLDFPYDHPRSEVFTINGDTICFEIPEELGQKIHRICQKQQLSEFLFFSGVLHLMFHLFSGQDRIFIGCPYANRDDMDFNNMLGMFLQMLPLKADFEQCLDFSSLLNQVKENFYSSIAYKDIPFEEIIRNVKMVRDVNTHPVFQVTLAYQSQARIMDKNNGLCLYQEYLNRGLSEYDFSFYIWETDKAFAGVMEYSTDLLMPETAHKVVKSFSFLLDQVVLDITKPISAYDLVLPEQRSLLLDKWNKTEHDYSFCTSFIDLFAEQAGKCPDAIALIYEEQELNYRILDDKSSAVAFELSESGMGQGDLVAVCMDRTLDTVCIFLGILKCGAAYLPVDPSYPPERIRYMLEHSGSQLLVSNSRVSKIFLGSSDCSVVHPEVLLNSKAFYFETALSENDLAYVLYTSGSTGNPKGVQITHGNLKNFLLSMRDYPGFSAEDRILSLTTFSFDISMLELYLPLISGGVSVLVPEAMRTDPGRLVDYLNRKQVNCLQATPVTWQMLITGGWKPASGFKALCGGEAMSRDLARWFIQEKIDAYNMYGPTETTVWSTVHRLIPEDKTPLIGKPIANTRVYVLDKKRRLLGPGLTGELYIAGEGVSPGYLKQEDLTSRSFFLDPYSGNEKSFMYKTGDLVRFRSDGVLEFIGRADSQIKLRGFRIELEEIEVCLNAFDFVDKAVCAVRDLKAGDKQLVAFVTSKHSVREQDLRDYLAKTLPDYMIPGVISFVDSFPLTPNGKIDRKALIHSLGYQKKSETEHVQKSRSMAKQGLSRLRPKR